LSQDSNRNREKEKGEGAAPGSLQEKKKNQSEVVFFFGQNFGRPILFLDRPIGNMAK
jgi:hypothetical protein